MRSLTDQSVSTYKLTKRSDMLEDLHAFTKQLLHDLRSPLGVIMLNASSISTPASQENPAWVREANEMIVEQARLMRNILDKADRIFDLQSGRIEVNPAVLDLVEYTSQICQEASRDSAQAIELNTEPTELEISIDPVRYREAVLYVLEFFTTHSQSFNPTQVTICSPNQDTVTIRISNPFFSIPEEKLSQIFTPFHRVQLSANSPDRGSGLGLFLAKTIFQLILSGELTIETSPVMGTIFKINLPVTNVNNK